MKRLLTVLALLIATCIHAQVKEGTIVFDMKMEGMKDDMAKMMGNMSSTLYFKPGKTLNIVKTNMNTMKTYSDATGVLLLMEQMGQKLYKKMSSADLDKQTSGTTTKITYTTEKKVIIGYNCTKAIITVTTKGNAVPITVWYTDKLPVIVSGTDAKTFKDLKGMPLQYTLNQGQMNITLTAKSISTTPVPDATFNVSTAGYTEMKK